MSVLACIMALLSAQGGSFRIGFTFDAGFPQMSAEKDYAELLNEGGLDFRLNDVAWTGGIEALGDVSEKVRLRVSRGAEIVRPALSVYRVSKVANGLVPERASRVRTRTMMVS